MNKFLIALLPLAIIGFSTAMVIDKASLIGEYSAKLLEVAEGVAHDDLQLVDVFRNETDDSDSEWKHLELPEDMKFWSKADPTRLSDLVRGVTVAIAKVNPESGIEAKDVWAQSIDAKVVKPCERLTEQIEEVADHFEGSPMEGIQSELGEHVIVWLNRFFMCEAILLERQNFRDFSYEVAQKNNLFN